MNSRPLNADDDHELPPSAAGAAPRVSARSRFGPPPTAAYDYGANDNYRAAAASSNKSKGGINGRVVDANDDGDGDGRSGAERRKDYRLERVLSNSSASAASSLSGSARDRPWSRDGGGSARDITPDRPWRTVSAASSVQSQLTGTSAYGTAEGDGDGCLGNDEGKDKDKGKEKALYDLEVQVTTASSQRWSQYETDNLAEEAARATAEAARAAASKIADNMEEEATPLAGRGEGAGPKPYRHDPRDYDGLDALEGHGNSLPPPPPPIVVHDEGGGVTGDRGRSGTTNMEYVKSRLSALVTQRDRDYERQLSVSSGSSAQSEHDRVRSEALKMLKIADDCLQDSPHGPAMGGSHSPSPTSATGLFRTKGGGLAMRELEKDEVVTLRENTRDVASLSGLDRFKREKSLSPGRETFAIDSFDEDDRRRPVSPNADIPARSNAAWSSRYSVERQLMAVTGGLDSTHVLNEMDRLHTARDKTKSARGLYRASADAMDGSHEAYGDYSRGASSSTLHNFGEGLGLLGGKVWLWLRDTLWSTGPELNYDGTTQSLVRREQAMMRRRRFRYVATFLALLGVAAGVLVHMGNQPSSPYVKSGIVAGERDVSFYVLSDEPYDYSNTEQLTRELEALPADAEFVVHLGNANGDDESMCQEYGFERAAAVLRKSAVPVLVIPGDLDWAACGSRRRAERSLGFWENNLGKRLTRHWQNKRPFEVEYSDDVVGNFAFLHKGVLFVSVNLVEEDTSDEEAYRRLRNNFRWTRKQLNYYRGDYHALVILGHAPPSDKQESFFLPVLDAMRESGDGQPALYLHANTRDGSFARYAPFGDAEELTAVQLEKRGREAPMRVMVLDSGEEGQGRRGETFVFERREPTEKRTEQ